MIYATGNVTQQVLTDAHLSNPMSGTDTTTVNLNFNTMAINWIGKVPDQLVGTTLNDLLQKPIYSPNYKLNIIITGQQYFNAGSQAQMNLLIGRYQQMFGITKVYNAIESGLQGTGIYNVNDTFTISPYPNAVVIWVDQSCCYPYDAYYVNITMKLEITVDISCSGTNFNNSVCQQYCSAIETMDQCYYNVYQYCFPPNTTYEKMPIGTNKFCQEYVANYIQTNGPTTQFDMGLQNYCQQKYKGLNDLFLRSTATDLQLCSCQMAALQYQNLEKSLFAAFPQFSDFGLNQYCLVAQCASSPYKRSSITKATCNLPKCLNISSFNNNGSITNTEINVIQTGCGTSALPWWVIAIILLILFIIIGLTIWIIFK